MKQKQKQPSEGQRGADEAQRECKSKREEGSGSGNGMACLGNVHLDPFTVSMILRLRHSPATYVFFKGPRLADRHGGC